jgi:hypothetical protein
MPLLPLKTQVNATTALYAPAGSGGGGGGGAGPNLVVSTLTAADGISSAGDVSVNGANLAFPTGVVGSEATLSINLITGYVSPIAGEGNRCLSTEYTTSGGTVYGPLGVGSLEVIGITSGGVVPGVRITSDAAGSLFCQAPSTIQCQAVSSINFSTPTLTLNGVPVGGGGSSGGIAVSSITTFPGQANPSTILMAPGAGGNFALTGWPGTGNPAGDILLDTNVSANALATNFQPGGGANAALILSPGVTGTHLNLGATDAGGALLAAVNYTGQASTLTVASDNVKFLQPIGAGGYLNLQADDANLYDLNVFDSNANLIASASLGTVGGRNQFYTDRGEVDDCMVSSLTAVAGANVQVLKPLAVSSIVGVSSINGAVYPPAAGGITRTQVATLPNISVPGTGAAVVISADFTPTNGHLYTLAGQVYGQVSPNVAAGSQIMFQIGNNGSVYQAPFPANGLITPFGTNILDVNMTWRHSTSGAERLYCYFWDPTNGANASTFTNAVANMDLIDYGPVA